MFLKEKKEKEIIALLPNKEKLVCGSREFLILFYVYLDGLTVLCLCPYVLIEKVKLLLSIFLG